MIALYPGAFKPPHRGHFEVVRGLLNNSHGGHVYTKDSASDAGTKALSGQPGKVEKITKVIVFPGGGERNGISKEESMAIWKIYAKYLPGLEIVDGQKNPMFAAKEVAADNPDNQYYAITGLRDESDFKDLKRITTFKNVNNVQGLVIPSAKGAGVRASDLRKAALAGNLDQLRDFFPKQLNRQELLTILKMLKDNIIAEMMNQTMENLFEAMFESADPQDGKAAPYGSGYKEVEEEMSSVTQPVLNSADKNRLSYLYDYIKRLIPIGTNAEFKEDHIRLTVDNIDLNENSKPLPEYTKHIASVIEYMLDEGMKITPLPEIKTIQDEENAKDFFGKTAYYDPNSKEVVLYTTGRHPKDIVRSFVHEMIHHMQNLEGRLGNIQTSNTNEDDHLMEIEKEAYLKGNITFRNWEDKTKNKQKEVMAEGRYDALTNKLSKIAFEFFKDVHDRGDKKGEFDFKVGNPEYDDVDIESNEFEFDFMGIVKYTRDTYKVDGGANAGFDKHGDEIQPMLNVAFKIPKNPDWQEVSMDIKDVIRHELEHLTQDGENLKQGKYIPDDQELRDLIDAGLLDKDNYYKLPKEIDAMIQGMYLKAKKSKTPFADVVDDYLKKAKVSDKEKSIIKDLWRKRLPALGIKQRL